MPDDDAAAPEIKRHLLPLACIAAVVLAFWWFDHPRPHNDELFFIAPAIHYLQTGHVANPAFAEWSPRLADRFYFQTPFYTDLLIGWWGVWGVSNAAIGLLFSLILGLGSAAVYGFLTRFGVAGVVALIAAFGTIPLNLTNGYRPDGLGTALSCVSFYLLVASRWGYPGYLLYALTCAFEPFCMGWLPLVAALALYRWRTAPSGGRPLLGEVLHAGAALVTAGLLFVAAIHPDERQFWDDFRHHATLAGAGVNPLTALPTFVSFLPNFFLSGQQMLRIPLYGLGALLLVACVIERRASRPFTWYALAGLVVTMLASVELYVWRSLSRLDFLMIFWVAVAASDWLARHPRGRWLGVPLLLVVVLLPKAPTFGPTFFQQRVGTERRAEARERLRTLRERYPERRVVADVFAARYLLDYQLSPDMLNWEYSCPPGATMPTPGDPQRQRLARISPDRPELQDHYLWLLGEFDLSEAGVPGEFPRLRLLGRTFGSFPEVYDRTAIIYGEQGELRTHVD